MTACSSISGFIREGVTRRLREVESIGRWNMTLKSIWFACAIAALVAMPGGATGRHKMVLMAHRGESFIAPENTLSAFKMAWDKGAKAVELDCYLTKDHKIVVMHDASTKRTGGVDLVAKDTDSAELRKLDLGKWKGEQFAGEKMPFLSEVLATIPKGGKLFVEIK